MRPRGLCVALPSICHLRLWTTTAILIRPIFGRWEWFTMNCSQVSILSTGIKCNSLRKTCIMGSTLCRCPIVHQWKPFTSLLAASIKMRMKESILKTWLNILIFSRKGTDLITSSKLLPQPNTFLSSAQPVKKNRILLHFPEIDFSKWSWVPRILNLTKDLLRPSVNFQARAVSPAAKGPIWTHSLRQARALQPCLTPRGP